MPHLRGRNSAQRTKTARVTGKAAAAAGLFVDGLFGLKGRPFARFMTVMGTSVGAMLPEAWDWRWYRQKATRSQREAVAAGVRRQARQLPERAALELFGLTPRASREELKHAWRTASLRWHPDKAPDEAARVEYHVRFIAYKAAYERLCAAYDDGRLPVTRGD